MSGRPRAAGGADPLHGIRQRRRAVDDVDPGDAQVGAGGVEVGEQLAPAAADVDDVGRALAVGEAAERLREERTQGPVGGGGEVPGGPSARR